MKKIFSAILFTAAVLVFSVSIVSAADPFAELVKGTRIFFPHIATEDGWETEVAVINPTAEAITGTMISYNESGRPVGRTVDISLAAHGRYQAEIGSQFANPQDIDYIVFTSSTFGIQGYTKFYLKKTGIRASIMASGPRTTGLFTKIDHQGWTGIAFVNTAASATANITLTAYSDSGEKIAVETMQVVSGAKVVKTVRDIFTDSVTNASYVSYTSDYGVVGFFLNGSGDNTMMDGSQAL